MMKAENKSSDSITSVLDGLNFSAKEKAVFFESLKLIKEQQENEDINAEPLILEKIKELTENEI